MGSSSLLDDLYCQEQERWDDDQEHEFQPENDNNVEGKKCEVFPSLLILFEQDMLWDDDELVSLLLKEKQEKITCEAVFFVRKDAVDWMLKVSAHYGFSILTSVLAINYLDRFLSSFFYHQNDDKPWMIQLVSVTCLSLAAKVEETHVPLLLDLQVGGKKYVFEAITIQRMELWLLSKLEWKMHPVTPLSFLDHIVRRLGLKCNSYWEFVKQCERLILTVVADSRFIGYLPSVMASASMMHVMHQVDPCYAPEYEDRLLNVLKISKEKVNECCGLILELHKRQMNDYNNGINYHKRKYDHVGSPIGVNDMSFSCDENSNDSWAVGSLDSLCSSSEHLLKKGRTQDKKNGFAIPEQSLY